MVAWGAVGKGGRVVQGEFGNGGELVDGGGIACDAADAVRIDLSKDFGLDLLRSAAESEEFEGRA